MVLLPNLSLSYFMDNKSIWEVFFAGPRGQHIFEQRIRNEIITLILEFQCPKHIFVANHL